MHTITSKTCAGSAVTQTVMMNSHGGDTTLSTKELIIETVKGKQEFTRLWEKGRVLGTGGFASVYEFKLAGTDQRFAAKVINKSTLSVEKNRAMIASEVKIHKMLSHSNIVKFEHCFQASNQVYILLELCSCSTLKELVKTRGKLSEQEARYYLTQIIHAVSYLHDNNVMHRDLKIGNMFLSENYTQLKVGDFGLSTFLDKHDASQTTIVGTPNYLAPEILQRKGYSSKIDVYSIGCCLYAMLYGRPPFDSSDVKTTYRKIRSRNFTFPPEVKTSHRAKNLVNKLLSFDPEKRPTCKEILSDEFFTFIAIPQSLSLHINATSVTYHPIVTPQTNATTTTTATTGQPQQQLVLNTLLQYSIPKPTVVVTSSGVTKPTRMRSALQPSLNKLVVAPKAHLITIALPDQDPDTSLCIKHIA